MRKYLIVSGYLYVCFGALLLYKAALLSEVGVHSLAFGIAAGKALVLGKFLLIGDAVRIGARGESRTLLHRIAAQRSVLLLLLLVVLTFLEELIIGKVHGHSSGNDAGRARRQISARNAFALPADATHFNAAHCNAGNQAGAGARRPATDVVGRHPDSRNEQDATGACETR